MQFTLYFAFLIALHKRYTVEVFKKHWEFKSELCTYESRFVFFIEGKHGKGVTLVMSTNTYY